MKTILFLLITIFYSQIGFAQLMKSFDNEKEWLLSWQVWEHAIEDKDYQQCSICMDSILALTNQPDPLILEIGTECYFKINQRQKAARIVKDQFDLGQITVCDDSLFSELLGIACLKSVEELTHFKLKEKLINLLIVDQYYRGFGVINYLAKEGYQVHHDSLLSYNQYHLDSLNRIALKKIFKEYGFPTKKMVGEIGLISIQMILQHADQELDFQKKYLPEIFKIVENGSIKREAYAYLLDRIKTRENELQIFGTQFFINDETGEKQLKPMIKPDEVNQRRMKYGMMPVEMYLRY